MSNAALQLLMQPCYQLLRLSPPQARCSQQHIKHMLAAMRRAAAARLALHMPPESCAYILDMDAAS